MAAGSPQIGAPPGDNSETSRLDIPPYQTRQPQFFADHVRLASKS
jgi:hypothetical protein